jgi:hypothetical protein
MAPLPPVANVLRCEIMVNIGASIPAGSRFFVEYTGSPPNSTDLNTLAAAIEAAWTSHWAPIVASSEELVKVIVTDLSSDTAAVGTWTGTSAGGNTGGALIASAAVVVGHRTGRRYRGGQPRTYMRGGTDDKLASSNQWNDSFLSDALGDWEAMIAAVLATTGISIALTNIVLVSYYSGFNTVGPDVEGRYRYPPKKRGTPLVNSIGSSYISKKVGSQRRRLDI